MSIDLDGINDYVSLGSIQDIIRDSFTVSHWFFIDDQSNIPGHWINGVIGATNNTIYMGFLNTMKSYAWFKSNNDLSSHFGAIAMGGTTASSSWGMLTYSMEKGGTGAQSTLRVYLNGQKLATVSSTSAANHALFNMAGRNFYIGATDNGSPIQTLNGKVADISLHTKTLSDALILEMYNNPNMDLRNTTDNNMVDDINNLSQYYRNYSSVFENLGNGSDGDNQGAGFLSTHPQG